MSALQALEMSLAAAPPGMITIGKTAAIGQDGFELTGLSVAAPDGQGALVTAERVSVPEIDWKAALSGAPPSVVVVAIDGLVLDLAKAFPEAAPLAAILGETVAGDVDLAMRFEGGALAVEELTLDVAGKGVLSVTLAVDGLAFGDADPMAMVAGAALRRGEISYSDRGLAGPLLVMASAGQEGGVTAVLEQAAAAVRALAAGLPPERASDLADPLLAFLSEAQAPTKTLTIVLAPAEPIGLSDVEPAPSPATLERIGLSVTYD
jgi:hypothetical protein